MQKLVVFLLIIIVKSRAEDKLSQKVSSSRYKSAKVIDANKLTAEDTRKNIVKNTVTESWSRPQR